MKKLIQITKNGEYINTFIFQEKQDIESFNGEEIFTDKYGVIKKSFILDTTKNEKEIKSFLKDIPFESLNIKSFEKLKSFEIEKEAENITEQCLDFFEMNDQEKLKRHKNKNKKNIFFTIEKRSGNDIVDYIPEKLEIVEMPNIFKLDIDIILNTFFYINSDFKFIEYKEIVLNFLIGLYSKMKNQKEINKIIFGLKEKIDNIILEPLNTEKINKRKKTFIFNILTAIEKDFEYKNAVKIADFKKENDIRNTYIKNKMKLHQDKNKNIILNYIKEGKNISDIIKESGLSERTIYRVNKKLEKKINKNEIKYNIVKDIIELYEIEKCKKPSILYIFDKTEYSYRTCKKYYEKYYTEKNKKGI